ncbi:hypothetical protein ILUMI_07491 [Ignelater luminosus]|uniref:Uncharacterized protein n=1 Tax=Ignelater luminosus TaxID=2038154 RepID=A0A8K0DDF0_IGNLU|nr:hypothetical protein ILUMI_07491 [Ignelater luminosus]
MVKNRVAYGYRNAWKPNQGIQYHSYQQTKVKMSLDIFHPGISDSTFEKIINEIRTTIVFDEYSTHYLITAKQEDGAVSAGQIKTTKINEGRHYDVRTGTFAFYKINRSASQELIKYAATIRKGGIVGKHWLKV